jgi:choline-phosphate cytidylyltransferase
VCAVNGEDQSSKAICTRRPVTWHVHISRPPQCGSFHVIKLYSLWILDLLSFPARWGDTSAPEHHALAAHMADGDSETSSKASKSSNGTVARPRSLTRTLSETLFGFARTRKRSHDEQDAESYTGIQRASEDNYEDADTEGESRSSSIMCVDEPALKKRRTTTKEEEEERTKREKEFLEQEKVYDDMLKPEYRKWRPKGHKLNPPPEDRPIRIYADGVFDLFHLGHMRQLEQCKKAFANVELVVGIPNDKETHARKGLTVLTDKQRYETVRHCKWVDEVVEDAPWILDMKFLKDHKIDYCAHDDLPYVADGIEDIYKPMKEAGMFIATQRTDGISTSDIITKIIRDYDKYLMRNFARGATRQELNVSWLKKNELELKKNINDFKSSWKQTNDNLSHMTKDLYVLVRESLINKNLQHAIKNGNGRTPMDRFASKFNANGLSKPAKKSLLGNFMDWVGLQSEVDSTDEAEVSIDALSPRKAILPTTPKGKKERVIKTPRKTPRRAIAPAPSSSTASSNVAAAAVAATNLKKTPKKIHKKALTQPSQPSQTPTKTPKKTSKKLSD